MPTGAPRTTKPSPVPVLETRLEIYRAMVRVRYFEKEAYDLFLQNLVKGTSHLAIGQEAIAAGVAAALRPDDYVFATYRGHAHALSAGCADGRHARRAAGATDRADGRQGRLHAPHLYAEQLHGLLRHCRRPPYHRQWGRLVGSMYRGTDQVTVAFFGDGTTNIGAFHEALNLAATWKLPVVFICENNLYMEYTPISHGHRRPAARR